MRPWIKGLLAGMSAAALGSLLAMTSLGIELEQGAGLSWLFKLRGPIAPPADVVVVAIDEQTGSHLGLSRLPREWPRSVHGRLVDNLTRLGATAIVFDFDFQQPKSAEDDALFAKAVNESGRVVLTEKLVGKRQPILDANGKPKGSVWMEQLVPPIPSLGAAAKGLGSFPLPKVEVAVHEFWAFKPSVGDSPTMPSVALQIHAMAAYPRLLELLAKEDAAGQAAWPRPLAADARAGDLRAFMRDLRHAFVKRPELAARLWALLGEDGALGPQSKERTLATALLSLYSGGNQRHLNFYGPPGSIPTVPYHAVLQPGAGGAALPDLSGKVAFVGFSDLYDPGQPDRFYTVFTNADGVDLSGVEIAATAFSNLLTHRDLRGVGMAGEIAALTGFGALVALLAYWLPGIYGVPLALALAAAYAFGAYHAFSRLDLWLPLAIPLLVQLPLALFIGLVSQYLSERDKKARATRAIGLYLPERLARDFAEKNLDSNALNRVTYSACLASDMAGFTTIAEKLNPKELAAFLNDYFEHLSEPLRRHHVDVIEFRADGIMCAWTAEQPDASVRRHALLAALEAVETIDRFKRRYSMLSQSLRIGIETGMVYVGHAGGGGHFVYSIVGDCANTAARIEGLNKHLGTQLLASLAATEGVDGLLTRYLGEFRFVGKAEALPILEILGQEATAEDAARALCRRFSAAMGLMKEGRWELATGGFESILEDWPEDGPSKLHLARCRKFAEAPPEDSPWVVHMDAK
jgi:adenylate cyclase